MRGYKIYLGILITLNALPILAPIFWGLQASSALIGRIGELIYFVYSFSCHQFASRSFYLFDSQWAWCARDAGIWLGILSVAIAALHPKMTGIRFYWVLPFIVPIALDGGIQTIATLFGVAPSYTGIDSSILYVSSNLTRFLSGFIFGVGLSLWISPVLKRALHNRLDEINLSMNRRVATKLISATVLVFVVSYSLIMMSWSISSKYKPIDLLDSAPKMPIYNLFIRRESGPCKTDLNDLLALECFF